MQKYVIVSLSLLLALACNAPNQSIADDQRVKEIEYIIAYNVLVDEESDNYDIFTMKLDGSEKKNVTDLPGVEWTYYAHNDELYFISDKDTCSRCYFLYRSDGAGNGMKQVTEFQLADSWMSSRRGGDQLIVKPNAKVDSAFYIIDREGTMVERLETGLPSASDPLFVADGRQVVFRGGSTRSKRDEGYNEALYIINVDGTGLAKLTTYPATDTTAPWHAYRAGPPKLHPSGDYVTYQSFQNGKYSLYAVKLDGSMQWKLTENKQSEGWHDWSPDGKWLAIEIFDDEQTQFHIGLVDWTTKSMEILTDTTYQYQQAPTFVLKPERISRDL